MLPCVLCTHSPVCRCWVGRAAVPPALLTHQRSCYQCPPILPRRPQRRASELDSQGKRDTSAGGSPDTADGDGSTDGDAAADELQTPKAQILRAAAAAIGLGLGW